MGRLSAWDSSLPKVLGAPLLMWIQWAYAAWQLVRKNPLIILLASLPLHPILKRKRLIIMLVRPEEEFVNPAWTKERMNLPRWVQALRIIRKSAQTGGFDEEEELRRSFEAELAQQHTGEVKVYEFFGKWAKIEYTPRNQFYIVRLEALDNYIFLRREFENHEVVFATNNLQVTENMAVARRVSEDDAMDMIFTMTGRCAQPNPYTFLTLVDSTEVNSKMWALLSLLPLYLQIHNHNKLANLLSLCVIFLDVNKAWIYHVYLAITFHIIKWIKLHLFKGRTTLYIFFSMFSSRWMYDDRFKCQAYETQTKERLRVGGYSKFKSEKDIRFPNEGPEALLGVDGYCRFKSKEDIRFPKDGRDAFYMHKVDDNVKDRYYRVHNDRANVALMKSGNAYVEVIVNKRLFVP